MRCNRCRVRIAEVFEVCWFCGERLCAPCWEEYGECGHAKSDETAVHAGEQFPEGRGTPALAGEKPTGPPSQFDR